MGFHLLMQKEILFINKEDSSKKILIFMLIRPHIITAYKFNNILICIRIKYADNANNKN